MGLHAPVKEIYLLARAAHAPGSGYRNERLLMSLRRTTVFAVERRVTCENWRRCVDLDWKFSIQKPCQFSQKPQRMKDIADDFFVDVQESKQKASKEAIRLGKTLVG
jgi:hypothetical protein